MLGEASGDGDGDGDAGGVSEAVVVAEAVGEAASNGMGPAPGVVGSVAISCLSVRYMPSWLNSPITALTSSSACMKLSCEVLMRFMVAFIWRISSRTSEGTCVGSATWMSYWMALA